MTKILLIIVVVVLIGTGGVLFYMKRLADNSPSIVREKSDKNTK